MKDDSLIKEVKEKIFDVSPLAILIFTPEMNLVFANERVSQWTGYGSEELLGKKLFELPFISPEARKIAKERFSKRLGGNEIPAYDFPIVARNGESLIGSVNGVVIKGENEVMGILIMVSNVTEKAKVKNLYEALVRASPDAVTATDLNGVITFASQQTALLHGFANSEELVGKNSFDLISPEDQEKARVNSQKTLKEGSIRNAEYRFLRKDGSTFIGELNASVIKNEKEEVAGFIGVTRDVTERKKREDELRKKTEEFERLNKLMVGRELKMIELKKKLVTSH